MKRVAVTIVLAAALLTGCTSAHKGSNPVVAEASQQQTIDPASPAPLPDTAKLKSREEAIATATSSAQEQYELQSADLVGRDGKVMWRVVLRDRDQNNNSRQTFLIDAESGVILNVGYVLAGG